MDLNGFIDHVTVDGRHFVHMYHWASNLAR